MKQSITLTINDVKQSYQVEPRLLLVDLIRDLAGLTGTNVGCETSQCGACTVHLNDRAVKSCTVLAVQADGATVTTIEGLARNGRLHAMQQAIWEQHGLQCGYCTPGMIMTAVKLVEDNPHLTAADVRHGLEGNLCRCTGYQQIVQAVLAVAGGEGK